MLLISLIFFSQFRQLPVWLRQILLFVGVMYITFHLVVRQILTFCFLLGDCVICASWNVYF